MEEITVPRPELKVIDIRHTSLVPEDGRKERRERIRRKRKQRNLYIKGLEILLVGSLALTVVQQFIIYVLQAGPI